VVGRIASTIVLTGILLCSGRTSQAQNVFRQFLVTGIEFKELKPDVRGRVEAELKFKAGDTVGEDEIERLRQRVRELDPKLVIFITPTRVDGAWVTRLIFQIPDKPPEIIRIPLTLIKPLPPEASATPSRPRPVKVVRLSRGSASVKLVRSVSPVFPESAKRANIQGTVLLDVTIAEDGLVVGVDVLEGNEQLAVAAAEAVKRWVYEPIVIDGSPAAVVTTIDVHFELQ
jgi:TonB family protein